MSTSETTYAVRSESDRRLVDRLGRAGVVGPEAVNFLRRGLFAGVAPGRADIEALFAIEASVHKTCEAWATFLIESVVDHVVWGERPTGVLDREKAEWLLGCVDRTHTAASFAILVAVLDEAHRVPAFFATAVRSMAAKGWPGLPDSPSVGADVIARRAA